MWDSVWIEYLLFSGLALLCLGISYRLLQPDTEAAKQDIQSPVLDKEPLDGGIQLTLQQLSEYDGIQNKSIYLAIQGIIFDVTLGKDHYGKGMTCVSLFSLLPLFSLFLIFPIFPCVVGGAYQSFGGKDVTWALAKHQLSVPPHVPGKTPSWQKQWSSFSDEEKATLKHWLDFFQQKYTPIGHVVT